MPLQATSGAASYDAFGGGVAAEPNYIEDVFSTYLYTGNGSTQTITNNIDLSTKGGLVWTKRRDNTSFNGFFDTIRGATNYIASDNTDAQITNATTLTAFNSNGFSLGADGNVNRNTNAYASWTFRKQPKFFDVVTYTGTGASKTITHSLGSTPGCIITKRTDSSGPWAVGHRGMTSFSYGMYLNTTDAESFQAWFSNVGSTSFDISGSSDLNVNGGIYVAYVFAHNAGGFGLAGTDNVISCGSFTTDGSANATVDLGYEPQLVIAKRTNSTGAWCIQDNMRGFTAKPTSYSANPILFANSSDAEIKTGANTLQMTATGFTTDNISYNASSTYIYIAIRRGPMKVPTSGTSVFSPVAYTGTNVDNRLVNTGIVTDMTMARIRTALSTGSFYTADRLRGDYFIGTAVTDAESTDADSFMTPTVGYGNSFSAMNGFGVGNDATRQLNQSSTSQLSYAFQRAPSFFDEVCYTGTGSATTFNHNLGVVPELMIVKERNGANGWQVYSASLTNTEYLILNTSAGVPASSATRWNSTTPTSTVFSVGTHGATNGSGQNFVNYLFATCAGVSKVGSYTGNGSTQIIDCGFTAGARFVLIKKTSGTGSWYVWDSARGIVSGNDPYLLLNSTAAEVTNTDYIDTYSAGFEISSTAPSEINENGGSFIFFAVS